MNKILIGAILLILSLLACTSCEVSSLRDKNERLNNEITAATLERDLATARTNEALAHITQQNLMIEKAAQDVANTKRQSEIEIRELKEGSTRIRTEYIEKLIVDPSCENQLKLILQAQQQFFDEISL